MGTPPNTTLVERTEWLLGLGEPKPRSRFWVAYAALFGAFGIGVLLWSAFSGDRGEREILSLVGSSFLAMWMLADTGGSLLYARRGAPWGRALRVFGYAVFFPSSVGFYLAQFWFWSTGFFVAEALFLGALLGSWAVGIARRTRGS